MVTFWKENVNYFYQYRLAAIRMTVSAGFVPKIKKYQV